MTLEPERELTDARFAEIGHPYRLFRETSGDRNYAAICSSFSYLAWAGRGAHSGQAFQHRISVYDRMLEQRIAVLDLRPRWPINDIAFHPTETKLLIGTGDYDGGYFFEGQLLLWDWTTGQLLSLLAEDREVERCRFNQDGTITAILRPRHEEEYLCHPIPTEIVTAASGKLYVEVTIPVEPPPPRWKDQDCRRPDDQDYRLKDLLPSDPEASGFTIPPESHPPDIAEIEKFRLRQLGFRERPIIRDLLWLDDNTIAAAHERCHLEVWSSQGGIHTSFSGAGYGVELLPYGTGGCLVNVFTYGDYRERDRTRNRSALLAYSRDELTTLATFDHACSVTSDPHGNILARDIEHDQYRVRKDAFLGPDGGTIFQADLGRYDSANHSLRLQGDRLYFLRGTPPESYLDKVLCSLDADGRVEELAPWDGSTYGLAEPLGVFVSEHHLVRAAAMCTKSAATTWGIERFCTKTGEILWSTPVENASFTALAAVPGRDHIVFAQANGTFGLIDATSGKLGIHSPLTLDGVPTIVTAIAVRGDRLVAGTINGRIVLFHIKAA